MPGDEKQIIAQFTHEERLALIGVLLNVAYADNVLEGKELDQILNLSRDKGFEDIQELLDAYIKEVPRHEDYLDLLKRTVRSDVRMLIVEKAIGLMDADGPVSSSEVEPEMKEIEQVCRIWNLDVRQIREKLRKKSRWVSPLGG
jgi:uncharacterized tellurite resistance protein B-like protein